MNIVFLNSDTRDMGSGSEGDDASLGECCVSVGSADEFQKADNSFGTGSSGPNILKQQTERMDVN